MSSVTLKNVCKKYDSKVVIDKIDLEIKDKEFKVINVNPYYPLADSICAVNEVYFA